VPTWFADDPRTFVPPPSQNAARLTILPQRLSAGQIEAVLGMPGDDRWERGEKRYARAKFAGVSVRSSIGENEPPTDHLRDVLDRLEDVSPAVRTMAMDPTSFTVRLWVVHKIPNWNPGLSLPSEIDVYVIESESGNDPDREESLS
jgi:hypothetical protein